MTWLTPDPGEHPAKRLRALLDAPGTIVVPGVTDGLTALLAREAGAPALLLSRTGFAVSMGMPDVGLVTLDELARAARQIVRVTRTPLVVEAGTGFGGPLNVMRTIRELEGARCAAIQIEDDREPSRHEHEEGPQVVEARIFEEKVAAARTAAQQLVVIARTGARGPLGYDEALRRGRRYREAGADVIAAAGLRSEDEFETYAREVPGPLLATMAGFEEGPLLSAGRLAELGYRLVAFPVAAPRVTGYRLQRLYADLLRAGGPGPWLDEMLSGEELGALVDQDGYAALDRRIGRAVLTRDHPPGEPPPRG